MTVHLDKKDVKNPDILTQELRKGFEWSTHHTKTVIGLVIVFFIGGISWSGYQYVADQAESKAQESFFKAEKTYLKKKESFEKFVTTSKQAKDAQEAASKTKSKDKKGPEKVEIQGEQATGNLDQDYGPAIKDLQSIVSLYPHSKAARLAALTVAEVYMTHDQAQAALENLQKIETKNDFLSALVLAKKGVAKAQMNDCKSALSDWSQVLKIPAASFIFPEIQLKQGLCYEILNQNSNAEESYNKIISNSKDGQITKTAEKYLRLLKRE